jgi:hypothetical protein
VWNFASPDAVDERNCSAPHSLVRPTFLVSGGPSIKQHEHSNVLIVLSAGCCRTALLIITSAGSCKATVACVADNRAQEYRSTRQTITPVGD